MREAVGIPGEGPGIEEWIAQVTWQRARHLAHHGVGQRQGQCRETTDDRQDLPEVPWAPQRSFHRQPRIASALHSVTDVEDHEL